MGLSPEEISFATDLFTGLGDLTTRRMMVGLCLYHDGTIFAIVHSDHGVMIKGAGAFIDTLNDMGCTRWTTEKPDGTLSSMTYWTLPDNALDDPAEAVDLARSALRHL